MSLELFCVCWDVTGVAVRNGSEIAGRSYQMALTVDDNGKPLYNI